MENQTFETAFKRLEEILQHLNSTQVALEEALTLYQEADSLIQTCGKKLKNAEQKIDLLIKKRENNTESIQLEPFETKS